MKLTRAQKHALLILEIQDAKRGWVRQGVLKSAGVQKRVLATLGHLGCGLVEVDPLGDTPTTDIFGTFNWRWRLTARGEREAKRLKDRLTAKLMRERNAARATT